MKKLVFVIGILCLAFMFAGCTNGDSDDTTGGTGLATGVFVDGAIETFDVADNEICMEDGKPVIRLYSTTWCPHCVWVADSFDSVAKEYVDAGKIVAYHWEFDTGDNTLTPGVEDGVPESERAIYDQFNPNGTIPTFVFGCKYYRTGTGHEAEDDLTAEENEFRAIIEELLK